MKCKRINRKKKERKGGREGGREEGREEGRKERKGKEVVKTQNGAWSEPKLMP